MRPSPADVMAELAGGLLDSCAPQQRDALLRTWADPDRTRWFYTPTLQGGLALSAQRPVQQQATMRLVAAGLSEAGYNTVAAVIGLENILDRIEGWGRDWCRERGRDPGLYWIRLFGTPGSDVWGWRFGGHHISLNYVIADGVLVSATPCFLGADPARAPFLGGGEIAPLRAVEDIARSLVETLSEAQLRTALLHPRAPTDIISGNRDRVLPPAEMVHMNDDRLWGGLLDDPRMRQLAEDIDRDAETGSGYRRADHETVAIREAPSGLSAADMTCGQRDLLRALVDAYESRAPEGALPRTPQALDGVHFAWAGALESGQPHYYRLQGPELLVEYDNTQRNANHAHSVWRRPGSDFGFDALAAHRDNHPH